MSSKGLQRLPYQPNRKRLKLLRANDPNLDVVASKHPQALEAAVAETAIVEATLSELEHVLRGRKLGGQKIPEALQNGFNGRTLETTAQPASLPKEELKVAAAIVRASLRHTKSAP